ncbi:MAG: hypothetical protein R2705_20835 [Ilumatobacteraceae bacterium]
MGLLGEGDDQQADEVAEQPDGHEALGLAPVGSWRQQNLGRELGEEPGGDDEAEVAGADPYSSRKSSSAVNITPYPAANSPSAGRAWRRVGVRSSAAR